VYRWETYHGAREPLGELLVAADPESGFDWLSLPDMASQPAKPGCKNGSDYPLTHEDVEDFYVAGGLLQNPEVSVPSMSAC
jgi:hypothetical protein